MSVDTEVLASLHPLVKSYADELVALRRDIHAHPELSWEEQRTTGVVRDRLLAAGLRPRVLSTGTGLICDVGEGERIVALRADIDALPLVDRKDVSYASTVSGVCHACGHDMHTAAVLGAGLVLADLAREGQLPGRVRLLFQPAEESPRSGARAIVDSGGVEGVERIFALHCDPRTAVGQVGLRVGAITASADRVRVRLTGKGGHTARPHLTGDLVFALGKVVTELPAALSRRVDPGRPCPWSGAASRPAGPPTPSRRTARSRAPCAVSTRRPGRALRSWSRTWSGPSWRLIRSAPKCPTTATCRPWRTRRPRSASSRRRSAPRRGPESVVTTERSLGGEDFSWYLAGIPGALARLGVRPPQARVEVDLHQGLFDADERAISVGARILAAAALLSF